ncbi:MAG: radical SAM protein [Candidatus Aphodosoma sp.]|nr:radical SAM protein [Candidatus Aphodosoma sp.]
MKKSRYSFIFEDNNHFFVYNTLSNCFLELDEDLYVRLKQSGDCNTDLVFEDDEVDIKNALELNRIITNNDTDEFLIFKSVILQQRAENSSMHLTLAPTMECCFSCHYCFENHKKKGVMSEQVMDAIIKYISKCDKLKSLKITWFGGEPLMAPNQISKFYDKLKPLLSDISFSSNIITTGYHLNEENINILKNAGVTSMQITLDGNKESHNKIKFLDECDDCFSRVLDNIELTTKLYPELFILIRVNLTLKNAKDYSDLYHYVLNRFSGTKVSIAPAFVLDRNGGCASSTVTSELFSAKDYPKYILELSKKGIDSPQIRYPSYFFSECAIRNNLAISFDPEGFAYKCWEVIGNEKYSIGKLNMDGALEQVNIQNLNRQLYGADPLSDPVCMKCAYLPICCGGCPIQRIQNEFENGKNICCTYYKNHIKEFMLEHIRKKSN